MSAYPPDCSQNVLTQCSNCTSTTSNGACIILPRECPANQKCVIFGSGSVEKCKGKSAVCQDSLVQGNTFVLKLEMPVSSSGGDVSTTYNYPLPSTVTGLVKISSTTGSPSSKSVIFDPAFFSQANPSEIVFESMKPILTNAAIPPSVSTMTFRNCDLKRLSEEVNTFKLGSNVTSLTVDSNAPGLELPAPGSDLYTNSFSKLKRLSLTSCNFQTLDWKFPPGLQHLYLSGNVLSEIPSDVFNLNLTILDLSKNNIDNKAVTAAQFNSLKKIETLTLSNPKRPCDPPAQLKALNNGISLCVTGLDEQTTSSSSNLGLIIGCAVGGVVLIAALAFFFIRRKKSFNAPPRSGGSNYRGSYTPRGRSNSNRSGRSGRNNIFGGNSSNGGRSNDAGINGRRSDYRPSDMLRPTNTGGTGDGRNSAFGYFTNQSQSTAGFDTYHNKTNQSVMSIGDALNPAIPLFNEEDMVYTRVLGRGAKGMVWLATYAGDTCAVKKLVGNTAHDRDEALANIVIESNLLFGLQHPRIIRLLGIVPDTTNANKEEIAMVMEFMDQGDLFDRLQKTKGQKIESFSWPRDKGTFALHIAEGLAFLHQRSPPLIHRDIKARNVLVDSKKGAKICDFGESRMRSFEETMTSNVGTARWIAPEVLINEDYSEKADIYSFGVLLSELDTHSIPYSDADMDERQIMQLVAVNRLRPTFSPECPERIHHLARACLQADPMLRPDAPRLVRSIMEILSSFVSL